MLTEITDYDPMYVYFNLNERDLLRLMTMYRERVKQKGVDPTKESDREVDIRVQIGLTNEEGYPHEGVMDFAESGVDADTGTIQLRGLFDNSEVPMLLIPGLFVRVRVPIAKRPDMPLVAERAIGADQTGQYVLVVNKDNRVEKRSARLGQLIDGMRVMEDGVRPDDWIVINGLQRARPGGKVNPDKADMASLSASAQKSVAEVTKVKHTSSKPDVPASGSNQQ